MSPRLTLMAAALLTLAATPVFAQGGSGGDSNINSFVNQQPGTPPVSNGIPVIVGNREGQPVIQYGAGGAPPPVRNRSAGRGATSRTAAAGTTGEAQLAMLLSRADAALRQGRFPAAAATLEQAETSLLNARPADGMNANSATLTAIGQARAAANRRDRNTALRALGTAQTQVSTQS